MKRCLRIFGVLSPAVCVVLWSCATSQMAKQSSNDASVRPTDVGQPIQTEATGISVIHRAETEASPVAVVGYLEFRDKTVTILDGTSGPCYSIATKDGKVLAESLSIKQLAAQFPQLYEKLKSATAANDARLRLRSIEPGAVRTIVVRER